MLFELEPDRSLTGGAWYSDQDFESEFVTILNQQCLRYLSDKLDNAKARSSEVGPRAAKLMATASLEEIWEFIGNLGISKVSKRLGPHLISFNPNIQRVCIYIHTLAPEITYGRFSEFYRWSCHWKILRAF
jgi:hypothetical protein